MKILCIGDSNTYGYDPRSWLGSRYPAEVRWTDRLNDHEVINGGINGMTVLRARSTYASRLRLTGADLIIVMLGTNDLLVGATAEQTAGRMESFLGSIPEGDRQILLIAPPHLMDGEWVESTEQIEESIELGKLYGELADRNGCLFADAGEWDIEMTFDGVHFSEAGHAEFAQRLAETLSLGR